MPSSTADYSRFSDPIYRWSSLDAFLSGSDWIDGIHSIGEGTERFDVLLRGGVRTSSAEHALPVFFNGAVSREGTAPPYFSGSTLAAQIGVPVVAIADPTLGLSESLTIGWYTGAARNGFQAILDRFLRQLRTQVGTDLSLVGGSAGGFAALTFAQAIECDAFVWNPQTDLLKYGPWAVREYLRTVLDDDSWLPPAGSTRAMVEPIDIGVARNSLNEGGIRSTVDRAPEIPRLIYLQNESDSHLKVHARPFITANGFDSLGAGFYGDSSRIVAVGAFAEGHRAPARTIIQACLEVSVHRQTDTLSALRSRLPG